MVEPTQLDDIERKQEWGGEDDEQGAAKVVMTGSASDPANWQGHIRNKPRREALANRFRNPDDPFKLAIVRDMWLTGFDAPNSGRIPGTVHRFFDGNRRLLSVFDKRESRWEA